MPTFTHIEVTKDMPGIVDKIFEFGRDFCVLPMSLNSAQYEYPTKDIIQFQFDSGHRMILVYADGSDLRAAVAFDSKGQIRFALSKPWLTAAEIEAGQVHPNGLAQSKYYYDFIRNTCGDVKTFNVSGHPSVVKAHTEGGVTIVDRMTGQERKANASANRPA